MIQGLSASDFPPKTAVAGAAPRADGPPRSPASDTNTPAPAPPSGVRVVVEPGQDKYILVFKLLDAGTGRVLSVTPNQTPQSAAASPAYQSGALLDRRA